MSDGIYVGRMRAWCLLLLAAGCSGSLSGDGSTDAGAVDGAAPDGGADQGPPPRDGGSPDLAAGDDAGGDDDAGAADAGPPMSADGGPTSLTLLERSGCFFTPSAAETFRRFGVGMDGTAYAWVRVRFDVVAGPFQPHIPDPSNRTEHILFGLSRANQSRSFERYVMGAAAVDFMSRTDHFRMYGREAIARGFMSYTADSGNQRWTEGTRYTVDCLLDGVTPRQRCTLERSGELLATRTLPVDYLDAATHLSSGFDLELGTDQPLDHDHLQSPRGWQFCDLHVSADPL